MFRGKFLGLLTQAHRDGRLQFHGRLAGLADKKTFKRFLGPLRHVTWVVYCKDPFGAPEQVLRYLSRYTHRVAISNQRLVSADDGGISFRWKDYRVEGTDRWKTMTLHPHQFIRRFLLHVLPKGSSAIASATRPVRQPCGGHRQRARAAGHDATAAQAGTSQACRRRAARAADTVPMLRRTHAHHRNL